MRSGLLPCEQALQGAARGRKAERLVPSKAGEGAHPIRFLHAADLHIDSPLRSLEKYEGAPVEMLRLATRAAVTRLVDVCLERSVDFVVLSGDIYDGDWRDYNTGLFFVREMARLSDAGKRVALIAGNHDAANKMTRQLRLPPGVHLLPFDAPATLIWDDWGVAIHGQSFSTAAVKHDLTRSYPEPIPGHINIGLLHTCADGREGHDRYAPCTLDGLRLKGYDYWALGHIHQRECLAEEPLIHFPGNVQGRHIRETGPKGCLLAEGLGPGSIDVEFVPLHAARWEHLSVAARHEDSPDSLLLRVEQNLGARWEADSDTPLVVRVSLAGVGNPALRKPSEEQWTSEIRSIATRISDGQIWVERTPVKFVEPSVSATETGGAMEAILDQIRVWESDDEAIAQLSHLGEELWRKLPTELRKEVALGADASSWVRPALADVAGILRRAIEEQGSFPA